MSTAAGRKHLRPAGLRQAGGEGRNSGRLRATPLCHFGSSALQPFGLSPVIPTILSGPAPIACASGLCTSSVPAGGGSSRPAARAAGGGGESEGGGAGHRPFRGPLLSRVRVPVRRCTAGHRARWRQAGAPTRQQPVALPSGKAKIYSRTPTVAGSFSPKARWRSSLRPRRPKPSGGA